MRSPMKTVFETPEAPVMKAGRVQRSRASASLVITTAAAPAERGQMSNSLYGHEMRGEAITASMSIAPFRCADGFVSALRRARTTTLAYCSSVVPYLCM